MDLGSTPLANAYLSREELKDPETWYPLRVLLCQVCHLAQTEYAMNPENVFTKDYAYLSSTSTSWLKHALNFVEEAMGRYQIDSNSFVIEVASNDGYLLSNFVDRGIRSLGVEPSRVASEIARSKGVATLNEFMTLESAAKIRETHGPADLVIANNVLAHVPNPKEMLQALAGVLSSDGTVVCEFAYLVDLVRKGQFDTIYHEHYSYLSLRAVEAIAATAGLVAIDAQLLKSHGGSLRVSLVLASSDRSNKESTALKGIRRDESDLAIEGVVMRQQFQNAIKHQGNDLLRFLLEQQREGKQVAAYGAAAKGNTLLNVFGIRHPLISFVAERSDTKIGRFMPGSRIPILDESALEALRPDFVLILPWNLSSEISTQLAYIRQWGARFVVASPHLDVL